MADPDMLTLARLAVGYDGVDIFEDLDLTIPLGRVTVLAGPNGCGKSTLLRAIRRLIRPTRGSLHLADGDILTLSERDLAQRIALLAQSPSAPEDLTVFDLVRLGRFPHQTLLRQWSPADADHVARALAATGVAGLQDRRLGTLSGGQRQRAWIAMVLAQDAPIICLDEPINHLDLAHQLDCLDLLRSLNRDLGKTVIVVLHDINFAARYADHLIFLRAGRVMAEGPPDALVTEPMIADVFGIHCAIVTDPVTGTPLCVPIKSHAAAAGRATVPDDRGEGAAGRQAAAIG